MKEAWWVLGAFSVMMLVGIARAVPFLDLIAVGQSVMLYGAAFGVPFEIVYFTALGVSLGAQRPVGWYWRPFVHHHLLTRTQRFLVLPFYVLGALSFAIATLGIAVVVIAVATVSVAD